MYASHGYAFVALFCGLTLYIVSILGHSEALVIYSLIRLSSLGYTLRSIRTVIENYKYIPME